METAAMRLQSQTNARIGERIKPGSPISDSETRKIISVKSEPTDIQFGYFSIDI